MQTPVACLIMQPCQPGPAVQSKRKTHGQHQAAERHAGLLAGGRSQAPSRHCKGGTHLPAVRVPAPGNPYDGESDDTARQVRSRGRPVALPHSAPRRQTDSRLGRRWGAAGRLGGVGAALRPDGPIGACGGSIRAPASAIFQTLPDPAGVARRPPCQGSFPRVLSMRRGRYRHTLPDR